MSLSLANFNLFTDHQCRVYARLLSIDAASGYGIGEPDATNLGAGSIDNLLDAIMATGDTSLILGSGSLATHLSTHKTSLSAVKIACHKGTWNKLEVLIQALGLTGVNSVATYLQYYNYGTGGTNTAIQSPFFRDLYYRWKGVYPSVNHVGFPVMQGGTYLGTTYTNALGKLVVGTGFTDGAAVDETKYCGGLGYLKVTGFTGASGLVTVTGTSFNPATGAFTTGHTWTATVTANGNYLLAVGTAPANALITNVSGISAAAAILAATTIYVEAWRDQTAGRLDVPF